MSRRFSTVACFALLVLAGACEGSPPWASEREAEETPAREDFGPMAAYERLLFFVGPGQGAPTAAVFDFAAISDGTSFRRGTRARLLTDSEWLPLLDVGWEMEPMRQPWRLVPHGPLEVVVGDEGELDALLFRDDPPVRLDPGASMAEYTPDGGTQLVLRQGTLHLGEEQFSGIILDSQHGRALGNASRQAGTDTGATEPGDNPGGQDTADSGEDSASAEAPAGDQDADSTGVASPSARPGVEGILLDNSGYYAVLASSGSGDLVWLHMGGQSAVRRGARLEAIEWEETGGPATEVPVRWRLAAPDGSLSGEVQQVAADHVALAGRADVSVLSYAVVSGWIQDREVRREVYGLIRHVR